MKKYEFTGETKEIVGGRRLHRIRALVDIGKYGVKEGDEGGWIEKEENLSHDGECWVFGNAWVYEDAWVCGNARVRGNADIFDATHILTVGPIGHRNDTTTFFRSKDNEIMVVCGCFYGDIGEFTEKVKQTHGDSKHARAYLTAIELAKTQIELSDEKTE